MRGLMVTIAALALLVMLVLLGGCSNEVAVDETAQAPGAGQVPAADEGPEIEEVEPGKQAADFTVPMVGGGEARLGDYAGKVLVLDFWATWCGACVAEFPDYQALYDSWDHDKVGYIGMSLDGDRSTVEAFLRGHPDLTLPMAIADEEMVEAYLPRRTLPSSRVIDPSGIVRYEFVGPGAEKVGEAVRRLLAEQESGESDGRP